MIFFIKTPIFFKNAAFLVRPKDFLFQTGFSVIVVGLFRPDQPERSLNRLLSARLFGRPDVDDRAFLLILDETDRQSVARYLYRQITSFIHRLKQHARGQRTLSAVFTGILYGVYGGAAQILEFFLVSTHAGICWSTAYLASTV